MSRCVAALVMVTLINGCVLFPHLPNWATAPIGKRARQTEIATALTGDETRQSLRAVARRQVTFTVTTRTLPERARLDARVEVATKSGFACAPLHGRACVLAQDSASNSLTLNAALAWNWQAGDCAILISDDQTFDVLPVISVIGATLDFGMGAFNHHWPAGQLVWPLLFGKFTAEKQNVLDGALAEQKFTVAELTSSRSVTIGNLPAQPAGIGTAQIGSTFIVQ